MCNLWKKGLNLFLSVALLFSAMPTISSTANAAYDLQGNDSHIEHRHDKNSRSNDLHNNNLQDEIPEDESDEETAYLSELTEKAGGELGDNLTWTLSPDGVCTISGTGKWSSGFIPDEYKKSIKSVIIKDGVTSIEKRAFENCSALTSVSIPDSVTFLGNYIFSGCSSLTDITIPQSVTYIGFCVFEGCSALTGITIPDSVITIGYHSFFGCSSLTSITIPQSVTLIDCAFADCSALTNISVDENNGNYKSIDGVLFDFSGKTLLQYPAGKTDLSYSVPDSVTEINEYAFSGCSALTSVEIPDAVTEINDCTFRGCSALTSITIPDTVTYIGDDAFRGCSALTDFTIPDSVTEIGLTAFHGCSALTSVSIPKSVIYIGDAAFFNCFSLKSVVIPDSMTYIGNLIFHNCSALTSVTIPCSVTKIGIDTFSNCSALTSITIPDSVTEIGLYAFENCSSLKEAEFKSKRIYLYDNTFKGVNPDFTMKGYAGSNIKKYADSKGYKFEVLSASIPLAPIQTSPEVCGEYSGKVTPKFTADENGNASLSLNISPETAADMKINSYVAYFDSDGNFTGAEILKPDENGDYKFKITDGGYKIMLWDELNPIISAVQQKQK